MRGEGLLLALDLKDSELAKGVIERCLEEGVLVNLLGGTTIPLAPPLIVSPLQGFEASGGIPRSIELPGRSIKRRCRASNKGSE